MTLVHQAANGGQDEPKWIQDSRASRNVIIVVLSATTNQREFKQIQSFRALRRVDSMVGLLPIFF